jgi:hypothetical protein
MLIPFARLQEIEKRNASPGKRNVIAAWILKENGGIEREIPQGSVIESPGKETPTLAATA